MGGLATGWGARGRGEKIAIGKDWLNKSKDCMNYLVISALFESNCDSFPPSQMSLLQVIKRCHLFDSAL